MTAPFPSLAGRTCVVTGATSGIGRATAWELAKLGARTFVVGRDAARARRTRNEIARATGNDEIEFVVADLSSTASVRGLATELLARAPRLDILVNNAATLPRSRQTTVDGLEMQLAVNHLASYALTRLLLPRLIATAPARIINVASQVESWGRIDFGDLQRERGYDHLDAYAQSKLANVLFTYELARRLEGTRVTANCLHPGVIATKLLADFNGRPRALGFALRFTHPGPEAGARTSVRLAADPMLAGVTGRYFRDGREAQSSPASYDVALARRLWDVSAQLVGLPTEPAGVESAAR